MDLRLIEPAAIVQVLGFQATFPCQVFRRRTEFRFYPISGQAPQRIVGAVFSLSL